MVAQDVVARDVAGRGGDGIASGPVAQDTRRDGLTGTRTDRKRARATTDRQAHLRSSSSSWPICRYFNRLRGLLKLTMRRCRNTGNCTARTKKARVVPICHDVKLSYQPPLVIVPQVSGRRPMRRGLTSRDQAVAFSQSYYGYSCAGHPEAKRWPRSSTSFRTRHCLHTSA